MSRQAREHDFLYPLPDLNCACTAGVQFSLLKQRLQRAVLQFQANQQDGSANFGTRPATSLSFGSDLLDRQNFAGMPNHASTLWKLEQFGGSNSWRCARVGACNQSSISSTSTANPLSTSQDPLSVVQIANGSRPIAVARRSFLQAQKRSQSAKKCPVSCKNRPS